MSEHKGSTNKVHQIKLPSSIDRVVWTTGRVCAGGKAGLSVDTHFVGAGNELKIQLKDSAGKNVGNFTGKITGKCFWKELSVSDKAKDFVIAKVKLSKLNLEMESNQLIVLPPVEIKNVKWDKSEARRGDILTLTANVTGIYDGAEGEIQIWEHDTDGAHDLITKIPVEVKNEKLEVQWEFEYKGDTLKIPSKGESEKGYQWPMFFFRVVFSGRSEDSGKIKFIDSIELQLNDSKSNPIVDREYVLILPDSEKRKGKTDPEGRIKEDNLPPGRIKLELGSEER